MTIILKKTWSYGPHQPWWLNSHNRRIHSQSVTQDIDCYLFIRWTMVEYGQTSRISITMKSTFVTINNNGWPSFYWNYNWWTKVDLCWTISWPLFNHGSPWWQWSTMVIIWRRWYINLEIKWIGNLMRTIKYPQNKSKWNLHVCSFAYWNNVSTEVVQIYNKSWPLFPWESNFFPHCSVLVGLRNGFETYSMTWKLYRPKLIMLREKFLIIHKISI